MTKRGGEFDFIARHLAPLATHPAARALTDDAAVLDGKVITKDMLVAGVHFRDDDAPDLIARKALRVNLSDLAGKGAKPLGYFLSCALPKTCDEAWRTAFAAGLKTDQEIFGLSLLGGDTVSTPGPLTLSVTMLGEGGDSVPSRADAKVGDSIWVSGTLGDAALGLDPAAAPTLQQRYLLPEPRIDLGLALRGLINASMDVSDGLLADAAHIVDASAVSLAIDLDALLLSQAAQEAVKANPKLWQRIVAGGDDYEILFTAPGASTAKIEQAAKSAGTPVTCIGTVKAGEGIELTGKALQHIDPAQKGFTHF